MAQHPLSQTDPTKFVGVKMTSPLHEAAKSAAKQSGTTVSDVVRAALATYLFLTPRKDLVK